jgi:hypothetical protein
MTFLLIFALYLTVGSLLDFHYKTFALDAVSRLANGFYILYSRDPHLAAVGFVWNPGSSIADDLPLLFYHLWAPLATYAFAATLVSAASMAGMVYQVWCTLHEWGVSRAPRLIIVAILALNGMILYYGANGMSEALYLFTLVATCRYLLRWLRDNDLASLVYAGTALGLCYLVRNEASFPAVLAGLVVLVVTFVRSSHPGASRVWAAFTDAVIFEIPFITAAVGWAVVSWVITGQAFQRITIATDVPTAIQKAAALPPASVRVHTDVHDILYLAPTIPLLIVVAAFLAIRRRDVGLLAPISVVGGGLLFSLVSFAGGLIPGYFRYFIASVPLAILIAGSLFATKPAVVGAPPRPTSTPRARSGVERGVLGAIAGLLALVLLAPSLVTTFDGMFNGTVGPEEAYTLGFIFHKGPPQTQELARTQYAGVVAISGGLAGMHLGDGQVLVDNTSDCIPFVIVTSPDPKIFVIPNDRDYQRTLADPLTFHTHYILEADPIGYNAATTTNTTYPSLWATGAGFARVVHRFKPMGSCPEMKLFRVTSHPNQT